MSDMNLIVSSSPHIKHQKDTRALMLDVIMALVFVLIVAIYYFGWRALTLTCVSVAACMIFEWLYRLILRKSFTLGDLSAIITGMLLAYCCPVTTPYWAIIIGDFFAIVVVKQLYGGLGRNFMNPALAARAFMFSWPVIMTTWAAPLSKIPVFGSTADVVTSATPMAYLSKSAMPDTEMFQLLFGQTGGSMGETCSVLLIACGIILVLLRVISPRVPLTYIGTVAVLTFIFPRGNDNLMWMLYNLLSGGLLLGAIFMATDYATSPITKRGQIFFGIGCGLLTVFIRYFGSYPEGVCYSILIMNCCSWLIDKAGRGRRFGVPRFGKGGAAK